MSSETVLRNAESSSVEDGGNSQLSGGVDDARDAEGSFVSSVSGIQEKDKKSKKVTLKKNGPLVLVLGLLAAFAILIFVAQSMMPFAIVNRFIEEFNSGGFSSMLRADNILDLQLSTTEGTFGMTEYQKDSLKENGIYSIDYSGGTILAYKNSQNEWSAVAGTSQSGADATSVLSSFKSSYPSIFVEPVKYVSPFIISVDSALADASFKNPYTTASRTWRGGNSGWYDPLMRINETIHNLTRSRFFLTATKRLDRFRAIGGFSVLGKLSDSLSSFTLGKMANIKVSSFDKGFAGTREAVEDSIVTHAPKTGETAPISKEAFQEKIGYAAKISAAASGVTNAVCEVAGVIMTAQTLMQAWSSWQQLNLVSGFAEATQMVQAGDSEGTPMNTYAERLMEIDPETGYNAMQSQGVAALFSGQTINSADVDAQYVNSENAFTHVIDSSSASTISSIIAGLASGGLNLVDIYTKCSYAKGVLNIVSGILDVVSLATGGLAGVVKWGIQVIVGGAVSFAVTKAAAWVANYIWSSFGSSFKDMATEWTGKKLGEGLISGGNKYLSSNHQVGGGSPGGTAEVTAYRRTQQRLIAEEAEYERSVRSPFDVNSQYTFLGSIVYNLIPMATTSNTGSVLKSVSSLISKSVTNLLPTASAISETNLVGLAEPGACPTLESIGIQGDPYCNPIYITDESTITNKLTSDSGAFDNPDKIIQYLLGRVPNESGVSQIRVKGTNANGITEYEIIKNTDLYKYAFYCGQRTSSWGFADSNIADRIAKEKEENRPWYEKIPILGGIIASVADLITDSASEERGWISGAKCVDSEENSCFWETEGKYFQRFIEDQRYLVSIGAITADPVYLASVEYYKENPLDNSFEGTLARYSGMRKDDVIATLKNMEVLEYIASYNPAERYAFVSEEPTEIFFEEQESFEGNVFATSETSSEPKYIAYFDVRNRQTTVI